MAATTTTPMPQAAAGCIQSSTRFSSTRTDIPECGVAIPQGNVTAAALAAGCSPECVCVIPAGTVVVMDSSIDLAALVVKGTLLWDQTTQTALEQHLCAG